MYIRTKFSKIFVPFHGIIRPSNFSIIIRLRYIYYPLFCINMEMINGMVILSSWESKSS